MPARHAEVLLQAEVPYGLALFKTEHELRKEPFLQEQCQVLYAVGGGGCTGLASEECVVAYKNQVIWTSGQSVRKRFTASSDILQVCWAHFGGRPGSTLQKGAAYDANSNGARAAGSARRSSIGTGAATDTGLQQRTMSLSTWMPSAYGPAGASTPEHQGFLGGNLPAGSASTGAGGTDAAGMSPSHLPSWWTNNTSAQSVGNNKPSVLQTHSAGHAAAAGSAGKASQHGKQTVQDAAGTPEAAALTVGAGAAAHGSSKSSSGSSPASVCDAVLCLLLKNSITCIFPSGELLECPLLQPCQALWPLPTGVILAGPSEAFAQVLTHPLEEPLPVVADCSLSTANTGRAGQMGISTPAAFAGWSQERVVWSSRELPFVATHNEDRGRLSIWHIRTQPKGTNTIGSAYDLPALSPFGLGPMRTPVAASVAGAHSSLPTFGSVNSAGTAAGAHAGFPGNASAFGSAAAAPATGGYVGGPAAYSGSMLGMVASGGMSPWSGPGSFARMSVGASTVKRSSLRSPAGRLPASIFSATPNPQNPITGALGALGPLRPAFSNTTAAQQALLLPGPDPSLLLKLIWRQYLAAGFVPDSAVQATDAAGLPLLCVLCCAAQQLLAFQLPGAQESDANLMVRPAFSTPALAAAPISTGAYATQAHDGTSSGSGSTAGIQRRQVVDLLVLQPDGKLVLHRGASALVTVRLLLPHGHMQRLQQRLAAVAAMRQRWQQHQQQQREGSPALGAAGGLFGGRRRSSNGQQGLAIGPAGSSEADMDVTTPTHGANAGGQAAASICGLADASGDKFDVSLQLGGAQMPLRVRLGVSWLPGLPSQVLHALSEVLDTPCFNRLLAACLTQTGACCGELYTEWRVIATVLLAWALEPDCLGALTGNSSSTPTTAGQAPPPQQQQQQSEVSLQPWQQQQQQQQQRQQVPGSATPATPQAGTAASDDFGSDDMELATPAAPKAGNAAARTPQQQQQLQTPGSDMAMSVDMSVDTASAATPATQRGPGRYQPAVSGTPMSMSGTPMSVSSKAVSRLRHQSSYRQDYGQQQQQQRDLGGRQLFAAGVDGDEIFPTAAPSQAAAEAAAVAAAQQSFGQLQLPQTPQIAPAAAAVVDPVDAWQQLLQSLDSSQLLQQLPCLQARGQAAAAAQGATRRVNSLKQQQEKKGPQLRQPSPRAVSQQQQQHRHDVGVVLLALHSLYQDCKLSRLQLHLLQLLGPVCWLLATWLDAPLYKEQYEREQAPTMLQAASHEYASASDALLVSFGSSSSRRTAGAGSSAGSLGGAFEAQQHLAVVSQLSAAAAAPSGGESGATAAAQQQQQGSVEHSLQQQQPADILRCLSLLLSGSQQYQEYMPYLASKGSVAVLRSLQLLQACYVLAGSANKCAAAIAAAAAGAPSTLAAQSETSTISWLSGNLNQTSSSSSSSSSQRAALVCELQHILLQSSQQLVLLLVEQGWDVLALDQLPVGVALPIKEALARCRGSPPVGWPIMAYALIGREDIAATLASNSSTAAATCTTGISVSTRVADLTQEKQQSKQQQQQQFEPGAAIRVQQQQEQRTQHLLLPYEQRLLLPSGSFLTGQQHHQRLPSAAVGNAAATANPRIAVPRGPAARGLRSTGAAAGSSTAATAAAAGGSSGSNGAAAPGKAGSQAGEVVPVDGMDGLVNGVSALRFSRDDRLAEARSLLGTNMPVLLAPAGSENDPDLPAKLQASLFAAAMRTMALPLGRGALTLGLAEPLPGEHVVVPLLCLSGVVPSPGAEDGPNNGRVLVNLDLTNAQPAPGGGAAAEVTAWCEFHNGVAAGLKIAPYRSRRNKQRELQQQQQQGGPGSGSSMASSRDGAGSESLSETWLPHSKPAMPNYAHAGVLLALGLNGHLDRLSWTDLYRYLSDQHDATTIAVLLGMSASCRGTADSTVARMLFLHLPARHPNTFPEIELSPHVQAASLLGLGLLYQGSCHRLMTETVLEEMCRTPGVNPHAAAAAGGGADAGAAGASLSSLMSVTCDREGYALAAGFGLGLICLGQGRSAPGLADLHLEDRLRNLMDAQVQPQSVSRKPPVHKPPSDKPNSSSSSTAAFGASARNLLDHVLGPGVVPWSVEAGDDPTGMAAAAAAVGGGIKVDSDQMQQYGISQVVLEGPVANTSVTGPAAAMALMMMYLKTHDADVAARFKVPDTAYALDHMRPDMVQLMALGRALIMWGDIQPTEEWLRGQLSPLLEHPVQTILDNQASPPAAASGGGSTAAAGATGRQQQAAVDWGAVGLAHVNAVAGSCFALGLRFAGTCSAQAEFLLRSQLLTLLSAKRRAPNGSNSNAIAAATAAAAGGVAMGASVSVGHLPQGSACVGQLDKAALENAIVVVLLSLAMVMAGSGHLPTFRLIQMLSRRAAAPLRPPGQLAPQGPDAPPNCAITAVLGGAGVGTSSLHYGHHLAVSLAGGLLFLSGGRSSLSTSNEAVAALLIALYPVWPCTPTDQRCHLQAFRHLYALAAEPRCLEALDVHSRRQVVVPLSVTAHTEGLAGAAAAAAHRQQQQRLQQQAQRQSVLKTWLQPTPTGGVTGVAGPAAAAAVGSGGKQQQGGEDDMLWSPRSADSTGPGSTPAAASGQLPPPAFAAGVSVDAAAAAGVGGVGGTHGGIATTPPLRPGLPPFSPQGTGTTPAAAAADGTPSAAAAAAGVVTSDTVSLRLQAPCLLPERQHLVSLRVCGPRYWAVELAAGGPSSSSSSSWSQQYLQHRICVKKKAGSLSYTDDHTGVKSLLFKAFYAGGSDSILAAAADADEDQQQQQQQQVADGSSSRSQQQHSFDITHLCQTFAADPQIQAFAQVLQAANAAAAAAVAADGSSGQGPSSSSSSSSRFLSFCNGALYECVVQEKTSALPAYLQLHSLMHKVCATAAAAAAAGKSVTGSSGSSSSSAVLGCVPPVGYGLLLQDLMLALSYYSSSTAVAAGMCRTALQSRLAPSGTHNSSMQQQQQQQQQLVQVGQEVDMLMWQPLLQPGFCSSLYTTLIQFWQAAHVLPRSLPSSSSNVSIAVDSSSMVSRYIATGSIQAAVDATCKATAPGAEGAGAAGQQQQQQKMEQLLAGCLAALQLPAAVQLQELRSVQQQQQQQEEGEGEGQQADIAVVLQLLSEGSVGQQVPPRSLLVLAAALQGVP